ncbi:hypothetical protein GCM10020367_31130 [Streptomyces sannanensis]|uniref:LamG-like jellyroll fold domain-containing protein n=2 Tax=Streptomyces sannanensis TaxID=285536 RepID=A0ABP6SCE3_9ACTN
MAASAVAAVAIAAAPGTAVAAENQPPSQPLISDLKTSFMPCTSGDGRTYVAERPALTAVLRDPDAVPPVTVWVKAEFEAWWQDANGQEQRRSYTTEYDLPSGSAHRWTTPAEVPPNTVISWRVRATDGMAWSPWSSDGAGSPCEFVYDDKSPEKPVVTSAEYPEDSFQDGVGVYGHFTVDSPSEDVVAYGYQFIRGGHGTVKPEQPGGPAKITLLPPSSGAETLYVHAIDRAGRRSSDTLYRFFVKTGRAPIARWKLADAAGSSSAAAETGPTARTGTGVTFGTDAPRGTEQTTAVRLDGTGHGFLTPDTSVVKAGSTFAVSTWVRPEKLGDTMTVASQDTGAGPGFALGLAPKQTGATWSFAIGGARVSGGAPDVGEWAHLLGLYDAETGTARLYVNGTQTGEAQRAEPLAVVGDLQIGRAQGKYGYRDRWQGQISDVRVYDRMVMPDEVNILSYQEPQLRGHWSLESATDGLSPEADGGRPLHLGGGATIITATADDCAENPECVPGTPALSGNGHLELNGTTAFAETETAVVDTDDSFSIGARVRLADSEPDHPMTVLSQAGQNADAFRVRYVPDVHQWQLVMTHADQPGAPETVVSYVEAADGGEGQGHTVTVVYDDAADQIRLYVDGYTEPTSTASFTNAWKSTGPLQIGRAFTGGGWGEYLHGAVDEVRAFSGALSQIDTSWL